MTSHPGPEAAKEAQTRFTESLPKHLRDNQDVFFVKCETSLQVLFGKQ